MLKRILSVVVVVLALANVAYASDRTRVPEGADYQRTGRVDAVYLEENRIVIDDIPYGLADILRIRAGGSKAVSRGKLRSGMTIGFKLNRGRQITEIWLLANNAERRGRR